MQTVNNHRENKNNDPNWRLIAEYSLNEATYAENLEARLLFQAIRDLGVTTDCLNKIEVTIMGAIKKATGRFYLGSTNLPVHIRLFCQRKDTHGGCHSANQVKGGWGYFLIEKGADVPVASHEKPFCVAELYLYQEGELPQSKVTGKAVDI